MPASCSWEPFFEDRSEPPSFGVLVVRLIEWRVLVVESLVEPPPTEDERAPPSDRDGGSDRERFCWLTTFAAAPYSAGPDGGSAWGEISGRKRKDLLVKIHAGRWTGKRVAPQFGGRKDCIVQDYHCWFVY